MRKEFNKLVETLNGLGLCQAGGEVVKALTELKNKIAEVETRIEVTKRISSEIDNTISKYTKFVDNTQVFSMAVSHHDIIQTGSSDINIALSLDDNTCIEDNWYQMFNKEKSDENFIPLKNEIDRYKVVQEIISKLKMIDVDGETMEYILDKVGMSEQMHSQLSKKFTLYDI